MTAERRSRLERGLAAKGSRQACEQFHSQHRLGLAQSFERFFEQRDEPGVASGAVEREPAPVAERGTGQVLGEQRRPCEIGSGEERLLGLGRAPAPCERVPARDQERAPRRQVDRLLQLERLQRQLVQARRLFVREKLERAIAGALRVPEGLVEVSARGSLEEVMGKLGQMRFLILRVERLERLAGASMQLHPPGSRQPFVQGLADERMPEPQASARAWHRRQHTSCDRLVEQVEQFVRGDLGQPLQGIERELAAEHGGEREHDQLHSSDRWPQPPPDHLADALRDPERPSSRASTSETCPSAASRRTTSATKSALPPVSAWIAALNSADGVVPAVSSTYSAMSSSVNPPSSMRRVTCSRASSASVDASGSRTVGSTSRYVPTTRILLAGDLSRDESKQEQRRLVGDVKVVEHEHERTGSRSVPEEVANRIEEPEARPLDLQRWLRQIGEELA